MHNTVMPQILKRKIKSKPPKKWERHKKWENYSTQKKELQDPDSYIYFSQENITN